MASEVVLARDWSRRRVGASTEETVGNEKGKGGEGDAKGKGDEGGEGDAGDA